MYHLLQQVQQLRQLQETRDDIATIANRVRTNCNTMRNNTNLLIFADLFEHSLTRNSTEEDNRYLLRISNLYNATIEVMRMYNIEEEQPLESRMSEAIRRFNDLINNVAVRNSPTLVSVIRNHFDRVNHHTEDGLTSVNDMNRELEHILNILQPNAHTGAQNNARLSQANNNARLFAEMFNRMTFPTNQRGGGNDLTLSMLLNAYVN